MLPLAWLLPAAQPQPSMGASRCGKKAHDTWACEHAALCVTCTRTCTLRSLLTDCAPKVQALFFGPSTQDECEASLLQVLHAGFLHDPPGNLPRKRVILSLLLDTAQGLQYLHSKGLIHSDIKASARAVGGDRAEHAVGAVQQLPHFPAPVPQPNPPSQPLSPRNTCNLNPC